MIEYIYFVKCPGCEDEHFDFFNDAKEFALNCLSQKPIITQLEVNRNDFGECTDSADLGTVWSWEDMMQDTAVDLGSEPTVSIFTKDDLECMNRTGRPCCDAEFDNLDNSVDFEPEISEVSAIDDVPDNFRKPVKENFYDFDIDPQIDEFTPIEDDLVTLWVAENLNSGEIVAACRTNDENLANRLLSQAFRERTGGDLRDCYIREAEDDESDYINDNPELLAEACKRKPIPEGMTLKELVEAMEENEDEVECAGCEELFPKDECFHKEGIGWLCCDCEDTIVRCTWCEDLFDKSECRYEVDMGWLCDRCQSAIMSRGETLTFKEGNYWDFLDEAATKPEWRKAGPKLFKLATSKGTAEVYQNTHGIFELTVKDKSGEYIVGGGVRVGGSTVPEDETHKTKIAAMKTAEKYLVEDFLDESVNEDTRTFEDLVKDSINHLTNDLGKDPWVDDFADDVIRDLERNYTSFVPEDFDKYQEWCSAVACEVSRQVNKSSSKLEEAVADYEYPYLAALPDAKAQMLTALKQSLPAYYFKGDELNAEAVYQGYGMSAKISDFRFIGNKIEVKCLNNRNNQIYYDELSDTFDGISRNCQGYKLLQAIKNTAKQLNKENTPSVITRRDTNVLQMLTPEIANEFKNHIKNIKYRIPLLDLYGMDFVEDKNGEELTDKAQARLEHIYNTFLSLDFAQNAIDVGIVENRPSTEDTNHNIETSWRAIGKLTLDCPVGALTPEAQEIIKSAKVLGNAEATKNDDLRTVDCYRLVNALIKYFNGNLEFFKTKEPLVASLKVDQLEEAADYRKRLAPCPECGAMESFDYETGICLECGFNV